MALDAESDAGCRVDSLDGCTPVAVNPREDGIHVAAEIDPWCETAAGSNLFACAGTHG